jgi:hypothetical protein
MKQKTLKEVAENLTTDQIAWNWLDIEENYNSIEDTISFEKGVEIGAKYQAERMYSKDEVLKILLARNVELGIIDKTSEVEEWFNRFKKK